VSKLEALALRVEERRSTSESAERPAAVAAAAQGAVGVGALAAVLPPVHDGLSAQSDDQAVWVLGGGGGVRAVVFAC
jgi:hypothetical protein